MPCSLTSIHIVPVTDPVVNGVDGTAPSDDTGTPFTAGTLTGVPLHASGALSAVNSVCTEMKSVVSYFFQPQCGHNLIKIGIQIKLL